MPCATGRNEEEGRKVKKVDLCVVDLLHDTTKQANKQTTFQLPHKKNTISLKTSKNTGS